MEDRGEALRVLPGPCNPPRRFVGYHGIIWASMEHRPRPPLPQEAPKHRNRSSSLTASKLKDLFPNDLFPAHAAPFLSMRCTQASSAAKVRN